MGVRVMPWPPGDTSVHSFSHSRQLCSATGAPATTSGRRGADAAGGWHKVSLRCADWIAAATSL
ncbi:hypothetical protein LMG26696_01790 [Achromobacter pulmonis]|nr:hypothetical protein LMG26696_01790 [Achromobacter pulmonis]